LGANVHGIQFQFYIVYMSRTGCLYNFRSDSLFELWHFTSKLLQRCPLYA